MDPKSQTPRELIPEAGLPISSIHNPEAQILAQYLETAEVDEWPYAIMAFRWFDSDADFGRWVVYHPRCEKAVALAAYWYSAPRWTRAYATAEEAAPWERGNYRLHDEIEQLFAAGWYDSRATLAWNPSADASFRQYDWTVTYAERPATKPIPTYMLAPVTGRDIDYESRHATWTSGFPPAVWAVLEAT